MSFPVPDPYYDESTRYRAVVSMPTPGPAMPVAVPCGHQAQQSTYYPAYQPPQGAYPQTIPQSYPSPYPSQYPSPYPSSYPAAPVPPYPSNNGPHVSPQTGHYPQNTFSTWPASPPPAGYDPSFSNAPYLGMSAATVVGSGQHHDVNGDYAPQPRAPTQRPQAPAGNPAPRPTGPPKIHRWFGGSC